MNTDDRHFGTMDSAELLFGGNGEKNGEPLPNGFRERNGEERNPLPVTKPLARNGQSLCGAKSKRTGKPCRQPAMANGRCRLHGGLTPSGTASKHLIHGRRSKLYQSLPKTIRQALEAENDERLADMRAEMRTQIGLLDEALEELARAYQAKDTMTINKIQRKLREIILERAAVVEKEHKRRLNLDNYVPVEKLVVMLMGIAEILSSTCLEEIDDDELARTVAARITDKIIALLPEGPKTVIEQTPDNDE